MSTVHDKKRSRRTYSFFRTQPARDVNPNTSRNIDATRVKKTYSFLRTPQPMLTTLNVHTAEAAAFSPTDISNLTQWLPDESAYIVLSGSVVSQWSDKSGNGHNVGASVGNRPTYLASGGPTGGPAIDFDGIDDQMTAGPPLSTLFGASAKTVLVAFKADTVTATFGDKANSVQLVGDTDGYWGVSYSSDAGTPHCAHWNVDGTIDFAEFTALTGTWYVCVGRHDGSTIKIKPLNGVETSAASGPTTSLAFNQVVSRGPSVDARIITVICYNRAITDTERDNLLDWAADRWNL